ncbi:MAG TPA: Maf family protein [Planctomycetota bacterium]|nr:Maf family protein [Planctomycetota bacterium]
MSAAALILASASPRRRDLLAARGLRFRTAAPDVDESAPPGVDPEDLARSLALRKALAVGWREAPALRAAGLSAHVLAADTVVAACGALLGKPVDAADAARMLRALSGTTHRVITGFAALSLTPDPALVVVGAATTWVEMRPLSDAEIAAYVASGEPEGKAGAYAIQETGDRFVTRLDGGFDNVVGLPVEPALSALRATGFAGP